MPLALKGSTRVEVVTKRCFPPKVARSSQPWALFWAEDGEDDSWVRNLEIPEWTYGIRFMIEGLGAAEAWVVDYPEYQLSYWVDSYTYRASISPEAPQLKYIILEGPGIIADLPDQFKWVRTNGLVFGQRLAAATGS